MNSYEIYNEFLFYKAGQMGIPYAGCFELTSRCNLDCKMCYIHRRANDQAVIKEERSTKFWIELAKECQKAGMLNLLLTGGEPFLRQDFFEIFEACKNLGMLVSVNSNGTCLTEDTIDHLIASPPSRMNITLYGASAETYEALCGDGSAYERVVNSILALKKAGILVKINYSVTPYNMQDMEAVFKFAKDNHMPIQFATYMFPPMRACEVSHCTVERLTPRQSAEAQICYDRLRFDKEELKERWTKQLQGIVVPEPDNECQETPNTRLKCRAGSSTFWITWDGKIRPCGMMVEPSFDIEELGFAKSWEAIKAATNEIFVPTQCINCGIRHACDQCAAICYAEDGAFTNVPSYMCDRTKAYLEMIKNHSSDF